jgi:hypothetical protein
MSTLNPTSYVRPKDPKAEPVKTLTGSADAIDITLGNVFVLNRTGAVNATTLASPAAADEGRVIWIINGTTQANTITVAEGLGGTGASGSYDVLTFTNIVAANVTLRAFNLQWYLVGSYETAIS